MFIIMSCKADATSVTMEFKIGFLIVFLTSQWMKIGSGIGGCCGTFFCVYECYRIWMSERYHYIEQLNNQHTSITDTNNCYGNALSLSIHLNYVWEILQFPQTSNCVRERGKKITRRLSEIKFEIGLLLVWSDNKYRGLRRHATVMAKMNVHAHTDKIRVFMRLQFSSCFIFISPGIVPF